MRMAFDHHRLDFEGRAVSRPKRLRERLHVLRPVSGTGCAIEDEEGGRGHGSESSGSPSCAAPRRRTIASGIPASRTPPIKTAVANGSSGLVAPPGEAD